MSWQQMLEWGKLPIKVWKELAAVLGDEELDDKRTIAFLDVAQLSVAMQKVTTEQYQPSSR